MPFCSFYKGLTPLDTTYLVVYFREAVVVIHEFEDLVVVNIAHLRRISDEHDRDFGQSLLLLGVCFICHLKRLLNLHRQLL